MHPKDFEHSTSARGAIHEVGDIDGQLKVGLTHRLPARAPATNGESLTSVFFLFIVRNVETLALQYTLLFYCR